MGEIVKFSKVFLSLILLTILVASLTACSQAEQYFVFGTFMTVDVASSMSPSKDTKQVKAYMDALEKILSPTVEGSDIARINGADVGVAVPCHAETMEIMSVAEYVYKQSDGAYDPSVYPLVRLWKFSGDTFGELNPFVVPTEVDILATKLVVGLDKAFKIDYTNRTITKLLPGAMLDFGGIAKGYASDMARDVVGAKKMLINLGGNISAKGKDYTIAVANPAREDRKFDTAYFGTTQVKAGECISTSGDYERYYKVNVGGVNKFYHHIIDPSTGHPADTSGADGIVSATVISTNGAFADAVATAVVVLGKEKGVALLQKLASDARYKFVAILVSGEFECTTFGDVNFAKEI